MLINYYGSPDRLFITLLIILTIDSQSDRQEQRFSCRSIIDHYALWRAFRMERMQAFEIIIMNLLSSLSPQQDYYDEGRSFHSVMLHCQQFFFIIFVPD